MISLILSQAAALLGALSWKTYGVILALAAGALLWLLIAGLRAELSELQQERAGLRHRVALQETALADRERALDAYVAAERKAAALRQSTSQAREEAIHAPKREDGPLAPVLRRAFERLR